MLNAMEQLVSVISDLTVFVQFAVMVMLALALFYVVMIVKNISAMSERARRASEKISRDLSELGDDIKEGGQAIIAIAKDTIKRLPERFLGEDLDEEPSRSTRRTRVHHT